MGLPRLVMAQMIRLLMTTAIFAKQKGGSLDTALLVLCVFSYVLENRPAALRAYIGKSDSIPLVMLPNDTTDCIHGYTGNG